MALGDDLVQAVFDRLCPLSDIPVYTAREIEGWRIDSRSAVAAVLCKLDEKGYRLVPAKSSARSLWLDPLVVAAVVEGDGRG